LGGDRRIAVTQGNGFREPSIVKEELRDLVGYLDGLPAVVRRSAAFLPYEQRAGELSRELILGEMRILAHDLHRGLPDRSAMNGDSEYDTLRKAISALAETYEESAKRNRRVSGAIQWGVLTASAGSLISGISLIAGVPAALALVVPFSGAAAGLAALYVWRFAGRLRQDERIAYYLADLRDEIAHSFGPSGEVLRPSEYYPASTKRVEQLLEGIRAHAVAASSPAQ
jgi:hypothetical protein